METTQRFDPRLAPLSRSVEHMAQPQEVYCDKARDVRAERVDGVLTLYCHADMVAVNRHPATLGLGGGGRFFGHDNPIIPIEIDGEEHRKWRRLLDPMFAPKQVQRYEKAIRSLSRDLIANFLPAGEAELHDDFCVPLPCMSFLRIAGAPLEDLPYFMTFKDAILHPESTGATSIEEINAVMAAAGAQFFEYIAELCAKRRAEFEPGDDVLAVLLRSNVDGRPVTDDEVYNIMFLLMFAGLDTVTSSLSCIFSWLGEHTDKRRLLIEEPALIPAAVEELLRYESPVPHGARFATERIDLGGGLVVERGEAMHTVWAAANLDPSAFDDPLTVDFHRGRMNHIAFASGTHRCLGSHLARLELRIAVEELLNAVPDYELAGPVVYSNTAVRAARNLPITFRA
ncbi:MAG: cytochrome P450 [Actinomycetota bacterium]|nr:cytochrome P450 [Actinomycetota bacterium]